MVGVAGRSKGCNTCRKRRIAVSAWIQAQISGLLRKLLIDFTGQCSLERPQCSKCIKSNRVCTGYQRERVFIFQNGRKEPIDGHELERQIEARIEPTAKIEVPDQLELVRPSVRRRTQTQQHVRPMQLDFDITCSVAPQPTYRQQLLSEFLSCYMPAKEWTGMKANEMVWIAQVPEISSFSPALEMSTLAVCTAKLGRLRNEPVLCKESLRFYGRGLKELQKALWDPDLMLKDETLAASMALLLYEAIECPEKNPKGWTSHLDGCGRLIRLRGAKAHATPLGHRTFLAYRINEIHVAAREARHSFLCGPEWNEDPWDGWEKTSMDHILDIATALIKIYATAMQDTKTAKPDEIFALLLGVVDECWKLDKRLLDVYEELEKKNLGPLYWPQFSKTSNLVDEEEDEKVFPVVFHFPNLKVAHTCMIYWAICILVSVTLFVTYSQLQSFLVSDIAQKNVNSHDEDKSTAEASTEDLQCSEDIDGLNQERKKTILGLPPLQARHDTANLARNICQSVEFCMQSEMGELGSTMSVIPLVAVSDILNDQKDYDRELRWARKTLERVHSTVQLVKYAEG